MDEAIWRDSATVWHRAAGGFERRVLRGCRVEHSDGASTGQVGPSSSPAMTLYVMGDAGIRAGDWVAAGACQSPEPPEGCPRAASVSVLTLGGAPHHTEVSAS